MPKKIYVSKSDEATLVIERVIDADATRVVLSLPKYSRFAQSESNFHLLKKEADALGKNVVIESVDERALELAEASDLEARNPFFDPEDRKVADILPQAKLPAGRRVKSALPEGTLVSKKENFRPCPDPEDCDDLAPNLPESDNPNVVGAEIEARFGPAELRRGGRWRGFAVILGVLVLSGALSYVALRILPRAEVTVVRTKTDFAYASMVSVDKTIREFEVAGMKLPGQIFTERRNVTLSFPASGRKFVSQKAIGRLTIYNSFSSEPQKLVASTRFVSPEGQIFRLVSAITVPGAKIEDGKIIPSSIEADIAADKPGAEYNVPPASRWSIPGFKGTPRYDAFYGASNLAMAGGYVGEVPYPADEDLRKAKAEIAENIKASARAALISQIPTDFKMIENAFLFSIGRQTVQTQPNTEGTFSIFAEGEVSVMAFREADLYALLEARIVAEHGPEAIIKSKNLEYGTARVDMTAGKMTLSLDFKAVLARRLDVEELKAKMLNKNKQELQAMLLSIPGLETASINLWPRWVGSVPAQMDKVSLMVD